MPAHSQQLKSLFCKQRDIKMAKFHMTIFESKRWKSPQQEKEGEKKIYIAMHKENEPQGCFAKSDTYPAIQLLGPIQEFAADFSR